jgi:hypothetical protein
MRVEARREVVTMNVGEIRNPQLRALAERVEAARARARAVAGGLSKAQLDWRPGPDRWGVGQCLEHLLVSNERLEPSVREQLAALRARGGPAVYQGWKPGIRGGFLIRAIDPATGKRKLRTGRVFQPGPEARAGVLQALEQSLDSLLVLIRSGDGLDLTRARVRSPMTRLITYHLGDAMTIMVVHLPRHLDQAERVKSQPGFPAS